MTASSRLIDAQAIACFCQRAAEEHALFPQEYDALDKKVMHNLR